MIITSKYHCVQESPDTIRVYSFQDVVCKECGKIMRVYDSRKRGVLDRDGKKYYIRHRRLRCRECGSCHSELPDFLLPYKRYSGEVILQIFIQNKGGNQRADYSMIDCAAEDRTILRWNSWIAAALLQCIIAIVVNTLQSDSHLIFCVLTNIFQLIQSGEVSFLFISDYSINSNL